MGKRIRAQVKGSSPTWRKPSHQGRGRIRYSSDKGITSAKIKDFIHDPNRTAPLADVVYSNGKKGRVLAIEGMTSTQTIEMLVQGQDKLEPGNQLLLQDIPEGVPMCQVEILPGDGGKLVRASGGFAFIVSRDGVRAKVRLPSKKFKFFSLQCRATVGRVASSGRPDKYLVTAGKKWHKLRRRHRIVSGNAKNPVDHPFGGRTKPGIAKSVSRHAPPGQKVGSIASSRTGRRKR